MIQVKITLACDVCGTTLVWSATNQGGLSMSSCLASAERRGWVASTKSAKCPEHRQPIKTHTFVPGKGYSFLCYATIGNRTCWRDEDAPVHTRATT